jgi:hypothetical protein
LSCQNKRAVKTGFKGSEVQSSEVQGSRYRVQGTGFKVQGSRSKVQGTGFKVQCSRFGGAAGLKSGQFDRIRDSILANIESRMSKEGILSIKIVILITYNIY